MRIKQSRKKFNYTILGFVIPFFTMLMFMVCNSVYPFGTISLLYSDGYHQYYPFFKEFRRAILSGESLLYSWNVGIGVDYIGLISYYLASPLNLVSIVVPESMLLGYFSMLTPIRLGLAGLFFSIFLKKTFHKNDISISLFGSFYALCAWALGYCWNVMWLDTFALLPLVILGMCSLIKERKFFLYTISLFVSVFSNYYIGFFTCIFVLLAFICYHICRWDSLKKFIDAFLRIGLCTVLAIGMTAVITLSTFAALKTTQSSVNQYPKTFQLNIIEVTKYKDDIYNNWDLAKEQWNNGSKKDAISYSWKSVKTATVAIFDGTKQIAGHAAGATSVNFKEDDALPNIYCGVITLILSCLFLICKEIKLREKICCVLMLFFLSLSFLVRQLDYIWHGFHFTNMIPYRFSFLYSFVMLYMAYRAYDLRKFYKLWQPLVACAIALGFVLISNSFIEFKEAISEPNFFTGFSKAISNFNFSANAIRTLITYLKVFFFPAFNFLIILCTGVIFTIGTIPNKKTITTNNDDQTDITEQAENTLPVKKLRLISTLMSVLLCLELVLNVVNYSIYWSGSSIKNYPKGTPKSESLLNVVKQDKDLFFRTETSHAQILNDGALNGYYGISTFTSSANVKITNFMQSLGYGAKDTFNRYCFESSSPVPELFLNLKYVLERDGFYYDGPIIRTDTETGDKYTAQKEEYVNPFYDVIEESSLYAIAKNNAYLPLGFMCDSALANFEFKDTNDRYAFENQLISAATGEEFTLWNQISGNLLDITGDEHVNISSRNAYGHCRYTAQQDGIVTYSFTADREGLMCIDVSQGKRNDFSVWLNNNHDSKPDERIYSESYSLPQMLSVCEVKPGDIVEVQFKCKSGDSARIEVYAAILDESAFRRAYEILSQSTLKLTSFSNTKINGQVQCAESGLLYTSVPQNGENWKVYVDNEEVAPVLVGDVMISIPLTAGFHEISFRYENKAFTIGCIISVCTLLAFVALCIFYYKPQRKWPEIIQQIKTFKLKNPFRPKGKYDKKASE